MSPERPPGGRTRAGAPAPGARLPRWRSLRVRVTALVVVVSLSPLLFVWLSDLSDREVGQLLERRVEATATEVSAKPEGAREAARRDGVWLRVVGPEGVTVDEDAEEGPGLFAVVGGLFFGPDGAPSLAEWDRGEPPPAERPLVVEARAGRPRSACRAVDEGKLLVCEAAARVGEGPEVVLVQTASRRAIRALYDLRYQLLKLVLYSLGAGLLLAWWLGWRLVRPVESLRGQVLSRAAAGTTTPVELPRDDELGDLAQAFNTLLAALDERRRANEGFATDLAHELKNPIAAVLTASELLRQPVTEERRARIERILADAGGRLDGLVTQFLELARAEGGLVAAPREEVELGGMMRGLAEARARREEGAGERGVTVEVVGEARARVAAERVETALGNLLENAVAFAREGEGAPRVRVEVEERGAEVWVHVADSGPGVAPEDRERVFERFFTRRRHGGTGLGLPLARAVAEAHGGALTVGEGPLGGAVFHLRLPRGDGG